MNDGDRPYSAQCGNSDTARVTVEDLQYALAKLDIFRPGLSYQETARLIFAEL